MYVCVVDAHRALELLEVYYSQLVRPQDESLQAAIEKIIRIFKSRLFQALLGMHNIRTILLHQLSIITYLRVIQNCKMAVKLCNCVLF